MFLFDTNIFLEILLDQDKSNECQKLLDDKIGNINISDFSLHSIGVILFRHKKEIIFKEFIEDTISRINIVSLSKNKYLDISKINEEFNLDFDDSYQSLVAQENNFTLYTLDNDFNKIKDNINVIFV